MALVFFSQDYAAGTELIMPAVAFQTLADMRVWILRKRNAHLANGWVATIDSVDSVEVTKTVIDGGVIVKIRRFFVR